MGYRRLISIHALLAESDRWTAQFCVLWRDFYPRSPCGERLVQPAHHAGTGNFYPRSPCGERRNQRGDCRQSGTISIHALLAESDNHSLADTLATLQFLSTLSLRRATQALRLYKPPDLYFYPRSPCGERLVHIAQDPSPGRISIHALLAESDVAAHFGRRKLKNFYPRSPCGERPAVLAGGLLLLNFYPRSPCGERRNC